VSHDLGYAALRHGTGALEVGRDVVRVSGPDAETYLQGQTSQDVAGMAEGASAWALVLQPQGKLDVFVRVFRLGPDEFLLDSDAGMGAVLLARLTRFKLRTKVEIDPLEWRAVAVRGPGAEPVPVSGDAGWSVAAPFKWSGLCGYDLLGPRPVPPPEATVVDPAAYEAARIEAGFPVHGRELDERTIPAEAGLVEVSVSFTKGCYTGQELVARIDSRGSNVPRHLRGLVLSGPAHAGARLYRVPPEDGRRAAPVAEAGDGHNQPSGPAPGAAKEVGRLTSVALSPRLGWVALGYVARAVDLGTTLVAQDDNDEFEARVEPLPLA
jgi:tRNA-modifying protein YgfZ